MRQFSTADIESQGKITSINKKGVTFKLIGYFNGKKYFCFDTLEKFFSRLEDEKPSIIFFHFGGRYDFLFLMDYLHNKGEKFEAILIQSRIHRFRWKSFNFVDSFSLFSASLDKFGKSFGTGKYKKEKIDFDTINIKDLKKYLKNDCVLLHDCLTNLYKQTNDIYAETTSSLAFKTFEKYFQDINEKGVFLGEKIDLWIRDKFYFGGRVEIFKHYAKNVNVYDINSLYPYSMLLNKFPIGNLKEYCNKKPCKEFAYYYVEIDNYYENIPRLPIRKKGQIFYPIIDKKTKLYCDSHFIERLLKTNSNFRIIKVFSFTEYSSIFSDFVNYFYDKKLNAGSESERSFYKLMLNGLYGKFAEKTDKEILINYVKPKTDILDYSLFGNDTGFFMYHYNKVIPNSRIQWATQITSNARAILSNYFDQVGNDIVYCDTDSIFTEKTLEISENLGGVKQEIKGGEFIGILPKVYSIKDKNNVKTRAKGIRQAWLFRDVKNSLFKNKKLSAKWDYVLSLKESLKTFNSFLRTGEKSREIKKKYDKRYIVNIFESKPLTYESLNHE